MRKLAFILLFTVILSGCANNKYKIQKRIDNFNPAPSDTFSISQTNWIKYSHLIQGKLKQKLSQISLVYKPNGAAKYSVYYEYYKTTFKFYALKVMIVQENEESHLQDELVYDISVFSHNRQALQCLAVALKIITDDLINRSYPQSITVNYDADKLLKPKSKDKPKPKTTTNKRKPYIDYSLYGGKPHSME